MQPSNVLLSYYSLVEQHKQLAATWYNHTPKESLDCILFLHTLGVSICTTCHKKTRNRVETLGEIETRPHAFLASETILESLGFLPVNFSKPSVYDEASSSTPKAAESRTSQSEGDVVLVVVVSQLNVLNIGSIMIGEQLGNISINGV
jgi:hypothetical protein